eukprot:16251528-Heterocapsa_arctica.AAC.1
MALSSVALKARKGETCLGHSPWLRQVLWKPNGHQLAFGDLGGTMMLACVACGSWASSKPIGLLAQCPG